MRRSRNSPRHATWRSDLEPAGRPDGGCAGRAGPRHDAGLGPAFQAHAVGRHLRGLARTYPANNDVAEGIRRVSALLEWTVERQRNGVVAGKSALRVSDACPHTLGEFEGYSRRRGRDGSFTEDIDKTNDDAMDALRYGVMELNRG